MLHMLIGILAVALFALSACAVLPETARSFTYMKMACDELPRERLLESSRLKALVARQRRDRDDVVHLGSLTLSKSASRWARDIARSRNRIRAIDLEVAGRCAGRVGDMLVADLNLTKRATRTRRTGRDRTLV